MTTTAAAHYLGVRPDTLRRLNNEGVIPCTRVSMPGGQVWRAFSVADLDSRKAARTARPERQTGVTGGAA
jgi:excisionase family DNA binding protein